MLPHRPAALDHNHPHHLADTGTAAPAPSKTLPKLHAPARSRRHSLNMWADNDIADRSKATASAYIPAAHPTGSWRELREWFYRPLALFYIKAYADNRHELQACCEILVQKVCPPDVVNTGPRLTKVAVVACAQVPNNAFFFKATLVSRGLPLPRHPAPFQIPDSRQHVRSHAKGQHFLVHIKLGRVIGGAVVWTDAIFAGAKVIENARNL
jgi:hypothetical protein